MLVQTSILEMETGVGYKCKLVDEDMVHMVVFSKARSSFRGEFTLFTSDRF